MSRDYDYATRNLLHYLYHQNYYERNCIHLPRQTNTSIFPQINFVRKWEKNNGATMFFIDKKQQKTVLNFSLDLLIKTD